MTPEAGSFASQRAPEGRLRPEWGLYCEPVRDPSQDGRCSDLVSVPAPTYIATETFKRGARHRIYEPDEGFYLVRCRRCRGCKFMRVRQWIARAHVEREAHRKMWFATLTFASAPQGPLDVVREFQRFAKRLRKGRRDPVPDGEGKLRQVPPASFRYVVVAEAGDQFGRWHAHALLHSDDLTWFQVKTAWQAGFIKANLIHADGKVDGDNPRATSIKRAVRYIVAYATGDGQAIRASLGYGKRKDAAGASDPPEVEDRQGNDLS